MSRLNEQASKSERLRRAWRENRGTLIALAVIVSAFMALRSNPSDIASAEALQADLHAEHPTLLYFYSNT